MEIVDVSLFVELYFIWFFFTREQSAMMGIRFNIYRTSLKYTTTAQEEPPPVAAMRRAFRGLPEAPTAS